MMKIECTIYMPIILLTCFCNSACVANDLIAVNLRHSGGWEIQINSDGSGSYGLGTIPARVVIKKGTFVFTDIIDDIKNASSRTPKNAESPYISVSYWKKGQSSAEEHLIAVDKVLFERLFKLAKANPAPPRNDLQKSEYARVEQFWMKNPPITPNKTDAGDGK